MPIIRYNGEYYYPEKVIHKVLGRICWLDDMLDLIPADKVEARGIADEKELEEIRRGILSAIRLLDNLVNNEHRCTNIKAKDKEFSIKHNYIAHY